MTDKELIKQEIKKRKQLIRPKNTGEMKVVDIPKPIEQGYLNALTWVEKLIDSMPEETKPQFPNYESVVDKVFGAGNLESWEYKEAERLVSLAKEELLKDLEINKEPASEDLEEELSLWMKEHCDDNGFFNPLELACHFAEWQKQRDDKHIGDLQWEAYLKGEQETKQHMMKDAMTSKVVPINFEETDFCLNDYDEVKYVTNKVRSGELNINDKVKIIIVKDNQ